MILDPVRPSAAVSRWYQSYLQHLIESMSKDIENEILKQYSESLTENQLSKTTSSLRRRWAQFFDEKALNLVKGFVSRNLRNYDFIFATNLSKVGIKSTPTAKDTIAMAMDKDWPKLHPVNFQITPRIKRVIDHSIKDNVSLIKSIPENYLTQVAEHVRESAIQGRDTGMLAKILRERFEVTNRRARIIAMDQNNKLTAQFNQARQLDFGISQAHWIHTMASLQPRETHAEFDGNTYNIDEGVDFGDGFGPVLPGEAINCGCLSRSIIPGFED